MYKKTILIIAAVMCVMIFAACGREKETDTDTGEDSYVYNEIKVGVDDKYNEMYPNGFDTQIYGSCVNNNNLYYAVKITPKYDEEYYNDMINLSPEEMQEKYGKDTDEGKVYKYDLKEGTYSEICSIDNVSELDCLIVNSKEEVVFPNINDGSDGENGLRMTKARYAGDGTLYVAADCDTGEYSSCLLGFDEAGNKTCAIYTDDFIEDIIFDNNGKLIVGTNTGYDLKYSYVDTGKGELSYETISGDEYNFGYDGHGGPPKSFMYDGYNDTSFYVRDMDNLYMYDNSSHEMKHMLNWLDTGIIGTYVQSLTYTDDGRMFLIYRDNMMRYTFGYIEKTPVSEKQVIKYAALCKDGEVMAEQERYENVIRYNRTSDKYKVKLIDYNNESDPGEALARDVMTGNIPDVIDINTVDAAKYEKAGLFCDLMPYLKKDDTLNEDYFTDGLIDVMTTDGKLYYIMKKFSIKTMAAKASDAGQYNTGWTMDEFIDYYNSKPEETMLSSTDSKSEIFDSLIKYTIDSYIDWNTGEVNFKDGEFKKLIEFCNRFPENYEIYNDYNDVRKYIKNGKILIDFIDISDITDLRYGQTLFSNDIEYTGYPAEDRNGTYICPEGSAPAMTASSENKEAAWDFIKSIVTYNPEGEYNAEETMHAYMPAGKEEFEKLIRRVSAAETYTEEDGTVVTPYSDGTSMVNNLEIDNSIFTDKDVELIRNLIKNAKFKTDNSEVIKIVSEEVYGYFRGSKSADDVVNILQDRVYKYVNENA